MLSGEYFLTGQREMASGFLLKEDHTFQFFFTYGALDRYGNGTWYIEGDRILFKSTGTPGNDFILGTSQRTGRTNIRIKAEHANPLLMSNIYCSLQEGADDSWIRMTQEGIADFKKTDISLLTILFEFCPERMSRIELNPAHNEFIIRPKASLFEVYFQDFPLVADRTELRGGHPLLAGNSFRYEKATV